MGDTQPYVTLKSRWPADSMSMSSGDSTYGSSAGDERTVSATHDTSRVNYHVKHLSDFARTLEDSASRAFPNRGRSQRYKKVQALLLHWTCDDLFVLPELEDLEKCFREDYRFDTDTFPIPSVNPHLELMMRVGQMIKEHESSETLFIIYYGGHARIDDSRQSTWCANRSSDSPWLQWSAIQTLLERSLSDVLILLDCCAGAASATFPTGNSITETISASSWDAIAPDPGRYSFTNALIEVLQEWKNRTYSAAMLHAEILARLKHPRPIMLNGKHFEARSTPVHFMMTANHRAPSIELARQLADDRIPPSPPSEPEQNPEEVATGRSGAPPDVIGSEPNLDVPHVMISLALEEDQRLDVNAWENWLAAFPAIAKYVKVQGVFKSHSTLLLLSLPVMVWDLLPEDLACNFVAFIRSNNLALQDSGRPQTAPVTVPSASRETISSAARPKLGTLLGPTALANDGRYSAAQTAVPCGTEEEAASILSCPTSTLSGSTAFTNDAVYRTTRPMGEQAPASMESAIGRHGEASSHRVPTGPTPGSYSESPWRLPPSLGPLSRQASTLASVLTGFSSMEPISAQMTLNQARNSRKTYLVSAEHVPHRPDLAPHIQTRLEEYFQLHPSPTVAVKEFLASNLGIETADIDLWFYHRREQQEVDNRLQSLRGEINRQELPKADVRMILPGHLNTLLDSVSPSQILLVDLRSAVEYERSHIHGAINFRAPASFVQRAPLELIERALVDDTSRATFNKWSTTKCIVFYDRHLEFAWECPTAEALIQKLRNKGWTGQGFILKGHYREFSDSFEKYIAGQKMGSHAKKYLESLQDRSLQKKKEDWKPYDDWLKRLEDEDCVVPAELTPAVKTARIEATIQHQKDLEAELERQQPSLYRKVLDLNPEGNWNVKAPMVEHLARGLNKMAEAGQAGWPGEGDTKIGYPGGYPEKLRDRLPSEDHDLIKPHDSDEDLLLLQSSGGGGSTTASSQKSGVKSMPDDPPGSSGDVNKKGREGGARTRSIFTKILRSGR